MIAFLIFTVAMIAFIVGSAYVSMHLSLASGTEYPEAPQLVTLSQEEVWTEERVGKPREGWLGDMGMTECVRRVAAISLGIVAVMLFIIIVFVAVTF
jgi:predicted membrane protein